MTIAMSAKQRWLPMMGVIAFIMGLITMMGLPSPAQAWTEQHFCYGVKLEGGVEHVCLDSTYRNIYAVYGTGTTNLVCVGAWEYAGGCEQSSPSEGIYVGSPPLEGYSTRAYIYNKQVTTTKSAVYGTLWEGAAPPHKEGKWFLRNSNSTGVADNEFIYGGPELIPVSGDWNGDGIDTPGAYKPSTGQWFLRNSNSAGVADIEFTYGGGSEMEPVVGDWNGDGIDTVGLYKPGEGRWFLRNSNTTGVANIEFTYGKGNIPIAGDWNRDGIDTIGLFEMNWGTDRWFLRNSNTAGVADIEFGYGSGNEFKPVVGDWNNDRIDSPGLYKQSTGGWFLTNSLKGGVAENEFTYGGGGETTPIAGDWNGDGTDTIGMVH